MMRLKQLPELFQFLVTHFSDHDLSEDLGIARSFQASCSEEHFESVLTQMQTILGALEGQSGPLAGEEVVADLGAEVNRWFEDSSQAADWLRSIIGVFHNRDQSQRVEQGTPKDSNGQALLEGDSVLVIKDLKVKGGSSDLKRGTLVKNIHLVSDPQVIECRVNGSVLVLKTCFLKRA